MRILPSVGLGIFTLMNFALCAQAQTALSRDWTGIYLGASLGGAEGRANTAMSTSEGFAGSYFTTPDPEQIAGEASGSLSQASLSAGVFAGVGKQFDKVYVGVEVSANSLGFDESRASGATYLSNSDGVFSQQLSVKADWQATLRARLGWVNEQWLLYVTGGVAAAQVRLDARFSDDFLGEGAAGGGSSKETRLGWVAGLGGEYLLNENWTIRGEYLYADYGTVDTSFAVSNPAFPAFGNTMKGSVDFRTQTLSAGLSYRF